MFWQRLLTLIRRKIHSPDSEKIAGELFRLGIRGCGKGGRGRDPLLPWIADALPRACSRTWPDGSDEEAKQALAQESRSARLRARASAECLGIDQSFAHIHEELRKAEWEG